MQRNKMTGDSIMKIGITCGTTPSHRIQRLSAICGPVVFVDPDIRNIQSSADPIYQAKTDIIQFDISWDLTDQLRLTSLTGYSKNDLFTRQDYNRIVPTQTFGATVNPVNFFNLCAISLPLPRRGGLSTGLMLVGRNGQDRRLFSIAAAVEKCLKD